MEISVVARGQVPVPNFGVERFLREPRTYVAACPSGLECTPGGESVALRSTTPSFPSFDPRRPRPSHDDVRSPAERVTELDKATTLFAMPKHSRLRGNSPSWLGNTLFIITLVLVVFFVWTYTVTSSYWSAVVDGPVFRGLVFVPGAGALVSVLLGGYWYTHRDSLSERATLVWILALTFALLGVPVACFEVMTQNVNLGNQTGLVR
jgi:hypothetical protein